MTDEYLNENDERIGQYADDWDDIEAKREYIPMGESPGSLLLYFTDKPRLHRGYRGKKAYRFEVDLVIDNEKGTTGERFLSTGSQKLRAGIKKVHEKQPDLFDGKVLVGIEWTGNGMDRTYDVVAVEDPWK